MDNLTVRCGVVNHEIYITDKNPELNGPTIVCTRDALMAVRDYMVDSIPKGENVTGISWRRGDGKIVKLVCAVEDE